MSSTGSSHEPTVQVFRPTVEEFKDFSKYIEKIESMGANKAGLAKIIPPSGWIPREAGYDDIDLMIPAPITQIVTGSQGLYQQLNVQQKSMPVKAFKKLAESSKYSAPLCWDYEDLERKYWKNIVYNSPMYGADISGSLYDKDVSEFNIQHLNTILDLIKEEQGIQIEGVNTAYLYFGMWKTTFAWHTEDMDLYSINYLHFGAPKSWYVIPPEHGRRFERLAAGFFHDESKGCAAFLRHKMTIISPQILKKYSIPYNKITQEAGEFIITFPYGYHSGFNHGFNCAESTNFALPRWVEYGKRCSSCTCQSDTVKICMDLFVEKFQPERFELWKEGKDFGCHPEDSSRHYAVGPKRTDLAIPDEKQKSVKSGQYVRKKVNRLPIFQRSPEVEANIADQVGTELPLLMAEDQLKQEIKPELSESQSGVNESDNFVSQSIDDEPPKLSLICEIGLDYLQPLSSVDSVGNFGAKKSKAARKGGGKRANSKKLCRDPAVSDDNNLSSQDPESENPALKLNSISKKSSKLQGTSLGTLRADHTYSSHTETSDAFADFNSNKKVSSDWKCERSKEKLKLVICKKIEASASQGSPCTFNAVEHETSNILTAQELIVPHTGSQSSVSHAIQNPHHICEVVPVNPSCSSSSTSERNWDRFLAKLWRLRPRDFAAEREFNEYFSRKPPHCAICIMFESHLDDRLPDYIQLPSHSEVKSPNFSNMDNTSKTMFPKIVPSFKSGCDAQLLVCSNCKVCVHAICYSERDTQDWMCTRCVMNAINAECSLCVMRGGALKPTVDGQWAHVVCANLIPGVCFQNNMTTVNTSKIPSLRRQLICRYCKSPDVPDIARGVCVQCQCGRCTTSFHVTCGYFAGVIFEIDYCADAIKMICTNHYAARQKFVKQNVDIGDMVIAKHRDKHYHHATVKDKYMQEYYSICFNDHTWSSDTMPEDIVSRDTSKGPPQVNESVQIKWTDGKIYGGVFKGAKKCEVYILEFSDGSLVYQERSHFYAKSDQVPKKLMCKISQLKEENSIYYSTDSCSS